MDKNRICFTSRFVLTNYNRVLIIPHFHVEDQGEYVCRARNEKISIKNSVYLTIRATPNFTIPLADKHMDNRGELTWVCEAFGISDVTYTWLRNGELLHELTLPPEDRDQYIIQDNVLKIKQLDPEKDEAMYIPMCCRKSVKSEVFLCLVACIM